MPKKNIPFLLNKAIQEFHSGNFFISKKILTDILDSHPNNFQALQILGSIFGIENNHNSALSFFLRAYSLEPNDIDLNLNIANAYINLNDSLSSLKYLDFITFKYPLNEHAWCSKGNAFLKLSEYIRSIDCFDKAISINKKSAQSLINKGCALNELKQFQEALICFENCLSFNPNIAEAWSNAGGSLSGLGRYDEASILFKQAIVLKPDYFEAWCNLGLVLYELKLYDVSKIAFDKSLSIQSNYPFTYFNKGKLLKAIGNLDESIEYFNIAISLKSNYFEAWFEMGCSLLDLNKFADSVVCFDECLLINPIFINAIIKKSIALSEQGNFELALDSLQHGLTLNLQSEDLYLAESSVFVKCKKYNEALSSIIQSLDINPNFTDAWSFKASIFRSLHSYDKAIYSVNRALELNPNFTDALFCKGLLLLDLKRYSESISIFNKILQLDPNFSSVYISLAEAHLSNQEYTKGWVDYDNYRFKNPKYRKFKDDKDSVWNGDKSNDTLFIWAEQGLGDQILYSSVFKELELYPQNIILSLDKKLLPIYQRSFPNFILLDRENTVNKLTDKSYDHHIPLGSVLKFFRSTIEDFNNATHPYIIDNNNLTKYFKSFLNENGNLVCGLSWQSSNANFGDFKSIPFHLLNPILNLKDLNFINLQYGADSSVFDTDMNLFQSNFQFFSELDLFNDIDSLASLIQACDVVVTCSNTTAHISGALNKNTLLLLPYGVGKFWYWNNVNGRCIWYPSVSIFQQTVPGSWIEPLLAVRKHLVNLI